MPNLDSAYIYDKFLIMNVWEVLILFFAFQGVIFVILFSLKGRTANRLFALFLAFFSYDLFYCVLYWSRFNEDLFAVLRCTYYIPLSLYGGIFYLYVRTLTTYRPLGWKDLLHAFPLLLVAYQFGPYIILPIAKKIQIQQAGTMSQYINELEWGHFAQVMIMFIYAVTAYAQFSRHYQKDPDLGIWLKFIFAAFLTFACSHIAYSILYQLYVIPYEYDYFIVFFMILFIGLVTYFAFMYTHVFNGISIDQLIPFAKYEKTGLSDEFSQELKSRLVQIMQQEKPYLDPDIRLDTIADLLDISRHHASQIINQHFSLHFYDFINKYRIQDAEHILRDPKSQLSITDVAYQTGFNNRISFYKAFKKYMGMNPSEYREHSMASL